MVILSVIKIRTALHKLAEKLKNVVRVEDWKCRNSIELETDLDHEHRKVNYGLNSDPIRERCWIWEDSSVYSLIQAGWHW